MANWDGPCDPIGDLRRAAKRFRESAIGQVHEPPPKPEFPRNPEEWGSSQLQRGYSVWSAWQTYLDGREPTAEEREEMNAALRAVMGMGDKSS